MNFKLWLESDEDTPSCIKGEWIYFPNGKIQNAIRSDKDRGHTDLIAQYYVTKYKKDLFEFYKNFRTNPCVNKDKLSREERDTRTNYASIPYFSFPPVNKTDITHKNFGLMYSAINDIISSDIYNNSEDCNDYIETTMSEGLDKALGPAGSIMHKIAMGHGEEQLEIEAMKHLGIILVRASNHFDMYSYDKNKLVGCIEAICAANQFTKIPNLYHPSTLETTIQINTFDTGKKSNKSITIKDLLSGEKPQQSFDTPGSMLPTQPFSKAAQMQADLSRDIWRQRTSESFNIYNK